MSVTSASIPPQLETALHGKLVQTWNVGSILEVLRLFHEGCTLDEIKAAMHPVHSERDIFVICETARLLHV